ncbi:putative ribonuclease H-like domain-containing protein [Tanacetum coccineum]
MFDMPGDPQVALKNTVIFDSGCSRHMTGNKSYLIDYQNYDGGYVAFAGSSKGGKIIGKRKNSILFTKTECLILFPDFKLPDESQVMLKIPRKDNMYNFDLKNIVPSKGLTCLFAKAINDESKIWHRRLGHINFKTMNKVVKGNLVRGLPSKIFKNDHTCVACQKGKQHKATLVIDDYSRLSWVFFLAKKDETSIILKDFITVIENQLNHKVKIIRCDNGTEFKNYEMNQFCGIKGIKREFSNAKTLQQNGVAKRKNRTLIEAARTITPIVSFMRPFGCLVTILNTLDHLGKFDGKADEGFLVGYFINSKAFRVYNSRTRKVEENLHVNFLENQSNVAGNRPEWLFDIKSLTNSMNYQPVSARNRTNGYAGLETNSNAGQAGKEKVPDQEYILLPLLHTSSYVPSNSKEAEPNDDAGKEETEHLSYDEEGKTDDLRSLDRQVKSGNNAENINSTNSVNTTSSTVNTASDKDGNFNNTNDELVFSTPIIVNAASLSFGPSEPLDDHSKKTILWNQRRATVTKWVFRNKKDQRGIVVRNKARLVAQGYRQEEGIYYDKVFAPVARIETIKLFLAYALFMDFTVYQMDVKSAFLYGTIEEEVYVSQPPGFKDPKFPNKVYKVEKALYGLHQAPRAWYETLSTYVLENGFKRGTIDKTLFIKKIKNDILLVQVYVVQRNDGIFLSQDKYVGDILKKFGFSSVKTASTPMETHKPLSKDADGTDVDVHLYRSMIGSLMYLTSSRPDIMFAVCACSRFQVQPKASHMHAVKRIFRYLKGQPTLSLWYLKDSPMDLIAYFDSDYAGACLDRKSTTKEYVTASNCCGQVLWFQNQLLDYGYNFMKTKIHVDNESAICVVKNPVYHSKTNHIEIRHHFISDSYEKKLIEMVKIHTDYNVVDLLTKAFDVTRVKIVKTKKGWDTKVPQSGGPFTKVGDEAVYKEWVTEWKRAATTASSLEVEQDSGSGPRCHDTILGDADGQTRKVKVLVTEASIRRNLKLEDSDSLNSLPTTEMFKQLAHIGYVGEEPSIQTTSESPSSRITSSPSLSPHHIPISAPSTLQPLDAKEDSPKQGRKISKIDKDPTNSLVQDEGMTWFHEDAEIQEKNSADTEILLEEEEPTELLEDLGSGDKGKKEVTTANTKLNTASASISTISPLRVSTVKDISGAETLVYIRRSASKDKSKKVFEEEQARFNAEQEAKFKAEQEQERIDFEIALKLQKQLDERKELIALAHVIDWSDPVVLRYHKKLKRAGKEVLEEPAKRQSTKEEKEKNNDDSSKLAGGSRKKTLARKRAGGKDSKESMKKQKLEDDTKKEELKAYLDIILGDDVAMDVESLATNLSKICSKGINKNVQIQALIDRKKIIVNKASIRHDLKLDDAEAFFSPQWKFLIHTILQCISAKAIVWNEFTMASAIIYLANNQKFNFSKYIFNSMLGDMSKHKKTFVNPSLTKKLFGNMKREGIRFSGRVTPLFDTMMVQASEEVGEDSDHPTDSNQIPIVDQPSTSSKPKKKQKSRRKQRQETKVPSPTSKVPVEESVPTPSNDPLPSGEDRMQLTELRDLCTKLSDRVLALETIKFNQALEIKSLKIRVKMFEIKARKKTHKLKRLYKVGLSAKIISSNEKGLDAQEDPSKQGRNIADIDQDEVIVEDTAAPTIPITTAEPKTITAVTTAATLVTTAVVARPKAKGIVFHDQEEQVCVSKPTISSTQPSFKDKGKAIMIELKRPLKKKDQVATDEKLARKLDIEMQAEIAEEERIRKQKEEEANIALIESWENTQAMMEADRLLAERLQTREKEELTDEKKAKLLKLIEKRRKHFAALRAQEKRNRPPTKEQKRSQMITYLKNIGDDLEYDVSKKQKVDEQVETEKDDDFKEEEMKKHIEIVRDDDIAVDSIPLASKPLVIVEYKIIKEGIIRHFQLIRADGSSKRYSSMIKMLQGIDKEDLQTLWKLVKAKHGDTRPEDEYERVL